MFDDSQTATCAAHSRTTVKASNVYRLLNTIQYAAPDPTRIIHKHVKVGIVLKTRRTAFRIQLHFDESMLSIECLSHLFVATLRCNATQVTNRTLSMWAFLRGTKNIPLSAAARQAKNVHGSEALHCLC